MRATTERTLRLLSLLQARPGWTGGDLAGRLEVTTRTLRSDIARLRRLGYRIDGAPGAAGGYRLGQGDHLPPLLLDGDEAVAVVLALRHLTGSGAVDESAEPAMGKLLRLLPMPVRDRARAVEGFTAADPTSMTDVDPGLVGALAAACRSHTLTRIDHTSREGVATTRDVEPHRLVSVRRRWYLLAWDTGRDDWRTFRLDRLRLPTNHDRGTFAVRPLPDDDPAGYVLAGIQRAAWPYRVEVIVDEAAELLGARLPADAVLTPVDDRSSQVELSADSPRSLATWLGVLDAPFRILEPARHAELLRHLETVRDRLSRAAEEASGSPPASGANSQA